ncbi:hypothetical protein Dimus_008594, partial [Dionaea muscipula]
MTADVVSILDFLKSMLNMMLNISITVSYKLDFDLKRLPGPRLGVRLTEPSLLRCSMASFIVDLSRSRICQIAYSASLGLSRSPSSDPFQPKEVYRGPETLKYKCRHDKMRQLWDAWHNHLIKPIAIGSRRACYATEDDDDYMEWYVTVTHHRVLTREPPPSPRRPQPREMSAEA